jgi:hypothetical protein
MVEPAPALPPRQSLPVILARDFVVTAGANLGDPVSEARELILDDVYGLVPGARRRRLALAGTDASLPFEVTAGGETGTPGNLVHLDCAATFMTPDGATLEALILVEVAPDGTIAGCYLLPLAQIAPRHAYALVAIDRAGARARLAEVACVSFARGTHITLANGLQCPIQDLVPGDRVLTRDHGPQELRWIGSQTVRATGAFAPIRIARGALNNSGDLMLSPNHRLFIFQRKDRLKTGRAEVMVRARQLVNGTSVVQSDGGFVEYFQLLFDQHEIIYAEGIAAESLYANVRVRPAIPPDLREDIVHAADTISMRAVDAMSAALDPATAVEELRRASAG